MFVINEVVKKSFIEHLNVKINVFILPTCLQSYFIINVIGGHVLTDCPFGLAKYVSST